MPMDPSRQTNFNGMQQRNFRNQSDLQNANSFQQHQQSNQHGMHVSQEPYQQSPQQFQRPQDQFQRPTMGSPQIGPRPQDQTFLKSHDPQPMYRTPLQEQQFQNKPDNFPYKTEPLQQTPDQYHQSMQDSQQQRLDTYSSMKQQETAKQSESSSGITRKEFGLQRQESYTNPKNSSPYFHNSVSVFFS